MIKNIHVHEFISILNANYIHIIRGSTCYCVLMDVTYCFILLIILKKISKKDKKPIFIHSTDHIPKI